MEISLLLLQQVLQLAIMILIGFVTVKAKILKASDSKVLSLIVLYVVVPCVIINSFQIELSADTVQGLLFALIISVILQFGLLFISYPIAKVLKMDEIELASIYYSNSGNLIVPIVTYVLGGEWVVYGCVYMCVQVLFIWTHGKALVAQEKGFDLRKILLNVNVISIVIGLLLFVLRISLPSIVQGTMSSIGSMVGPLSMIVTGMLMADMSFKEVFGNRRTYIVTFVRLIIMPLLTLGVFLLVQPQNMIVDGKQILLIVFLATITPTASSITQLAQVYDKDSKYAGAICVMTTIFAMVTMPLMVLLFQTLL